jgi:predicted RecA/RadA family phage recombinase
MATIEAQRYQDSTSPFDLTAAAAYTGGEVIQIPDGRAAVVPTDIASGAIAAPVATGVFTLQKTASIAILEGGRVYWDHSANKAHYKKVNDRDFYVGRAFADATESGTTVKVSLNVDPPYDIDLLRDAALSVPTGTAAAGGFGYPQRVGGAVQLELTATSEVQCVDVLSVDRVAIASKGIAEFIFRPAVNGSTSAVDFNVGLANGTSTSDADAVTEHVYFHIDGGALLINAQSKDGTTTVTSTDTTKVIVAGSAVAQRSECWIDFRTSSAIALYVDGVRVLSGTTFTLAAGTGPIGLLAHLEKTTGTATGKFVIDAARLRVMQQA